MILNSSTNAELKSYEVQTAANWVRNGTKLLRLAAADARLLLSSYLESLNCLLFDPIKTFDFILF